MGFGYIPKNCRYLVLLLGIFFQQRLGHSRVQVSSLGSACPESPSPASRTYLPSGG